MSFEGYYEVLCANGHYDCVDIYNERNPHDNEWKCYSCGAHVAWVHLVDCTNGTGEFLRDKLRKLCDANVWTCPTCLTDRVIEDTVYAIPD
jgi:hypothetical protein